MEIRTGHGYDVHRLTQGRKLILGGVEIPWEKGLLGHSDADVLVHAVMDALLGAAALGDIGRHFPDTDPRYAGADSICLLKQVVLLLKGKGYSCLLYTSRCAAGKLQLFCLPFAGPCRLSGDPARVQADGCRDRCV